MRFVLHDLVGLSAIGALPGCADVPEIADDVLAEADVFAREILDPLDAPGDRAGSTFDNGTVTTPPGFAAAYRRYAEAGWVGLAAAAEHGGQGFPHVLDIATVEMFQAANVSFSNGPLLNAAAIRALDAAASPALRARYAPRLASGEWMSTMCLTEPQAGSDLGATRATAHPDGDAYRLRGQKIFITYGEHDWTPNIVHFVLARLPDAPPGTKGLSLFAVPKFHVADDGSLGARNDVVCAGIEHKLGQRANPTCTLTFGEAGEGAFADLVGAPHRGLETMFVLMNAVRLIVGVQGVALADRAYQKAVVYARERVQFGVPILAHPDIRRMLFGARARIEAMRALTYVAAGWLDHAEREPDAVARDAHRALADLAIPVVKGWCTESAQAICGSAVQIFGGMGYVEETGIAQQLRDVRVATMYEGTTQIQALDFLHRKLARDECATLQRIVAAMHADADQLAAIAGDASTLGLPLRDASTLALPLRDASDALARTAAHVVALAATDRRAADAVSVPLLLLAGTVAGGWQLFRGAHVSATRLAAGRGDAFDRAKIATAIFYAGHVLTERHALEAAIHAGAATALDAADAAFSIERTPPRPTVTPSNVGQRSA